MVGAIVLDLANPYFMTLARGLEDRLTVAGYNLLVCSSDGDAKREALLMHRLLQRGVSGLLVTPCESTVHNLSVIRRVGCPVVLMDARNRDDGVATVGVDDVAGGRLAVQHLVARGHRCIGMINASHSLPHCEARWRGAKSVADHTEGVCLSEVVVSGQGAGPAREAARRLLSQRPEITGVFCFNDVAALGAMGAVSDMGRRVPRDVAVVGYDDIEFAGQLTVPLTSVRQPMREMGWSAADLLLAEPAETRHLVFEPELVIREST